MKGQQRNKKKEKKKVGFGLLQSGGPWHKCVSLVVFFLPNCRLAYFAAEKEW